MGQARLESVKPALPDSPLRTALSLAIFLHLFAVAVALAAYTRSSELQQQLRQLLGVYTQPLNFDLSYRSYTPAQLFLTHGTEIDVNFAVRVDAGAGTTGSATLPEPGLRPRLRLQRRQSLANMAGNLAGNEAVESFLIKGIAGRALSEAGAGKGRVRLTAHYLVDRATVRRGPPPDPLAPNRFADVYDADVVLADGQVDLLKRTTSQETAPERRGR